MIKLLPLFLLAMTASLAQGAGKPISTEPVRYELDGVTFEGTVARPAVEAGKQLPAVLIVPDWMGPRPYFDAIAGDIAELGYIALVADLYGADARPTNGQEASKFAGALRQGDRSVLRARMQKSLEVLRAQEGVDSGRIAAIGYCFGGAAVLELARSGADISGVVSLHGGVSPVNPADAANIKAKVLILHGSKDPVDDWEDLAAVKEELDAAKVDWQMVVFGGAVHAFTDPNASAAGVAEYDPNAAKRSWEYMKGFFQEVFTADGD